MLTDRFLENVSKRFQRTFNVPLLLKSISERDGILLKDCCFCLQMNDSLNYRGWAKNGVQDIEEVKQI